MKAIVTVHLKPGVLDPQGRAIAHALASLSFDEVGDVRVGKVITVELTGTDEKAARARAEEMGRRLLANTVVETFTVEIVSSAAPLAGEGRGGG